MPEQGRAAEPSNPEPSILTEDVDNSGGPAENRLLGMFFPIRTDSPLRTTPYMNLALIGVNILVFIAQSIHTPAAVARDWYAPLMLDAARPELYQFITCGFLHAGLTHIGFNMLFLFIFGNNVNDKFGHVGYLAFYLAADAFSAIAFCYWDQAGLALGASGAVSAVVGAYLILFPRAYITIFYIFFLTTYEIPSLYFVLFYFISDVIGLQGRSDVAHSAHVGGTLFGLLTSVALLWVGLLPRDQFDVVALMKQWNRRRQYRDAVSKGWNPYGAAAPASPRKGWVDTAEPPARVLSDQENRVMELRGQISAAATGHDLPTAARLYLELKSIDPSQVLARQSQLDIANQLAQDQRFPEAAEAYETFLQNYPKYEQTEQVELMLGIVLSRFLNQPARAREFLLRASAKLMDESAGRMARAELEKIDRAAAASQSADSAGGIGPGVSGSAGIAGTP